MKVPLSWLKDHVTWDLSVDELMERLTLGGLEVGSVEHLGEQWDREAIFVGQVVSVRPHPNADRLVLVTVDYGRDETVEVVTGAPNLHVGDSGQKVVFATVGASLIDAYADTLKYKKLKKSKIRGVDSVGMVCSEKELGISDEHTGNLILPNDAPVGMPFVDYWGDVIPDLDLTPNLARCFSMTGVAREVAALTGATLHITEPTVQADGPTIEGQIDIEILDPDLCPRYSASLIKGVRIGPSPRWMQRRLLMAGMRPINNVVDITNYVMLELGQPLHAFDYGLIRPTQPAEIPTIIVRRATAGEKMMTLDGVEREFSEDTLLITDGGGPVAIAGVMGGMESEVSEKTTDILLEAASFDFISIRRTSGALKLPSEAASRFGRGVDPELTLVALRRASELMRELAHGTVSAGFADVYPGVPQPKVIDFQISEVERLLGIKLSATEIAAILEALGFGCEIGDGAIPIVRTTVPSYRLDVTIPADLVEEVARIYGYDRLPTTLIDDQMPRQERNIALEVEERARDILVGAGLAETITYSMTNLESVSWLDLAGEVPEPSSYLRLANPLSREFEYLRKSLLNTSLEALARNLRFLDRVAIFEIAHVYLPVDGQELPDEPLRLSITLCGPREQRSWLASESQPMDFYDIKGLVETLCSHLGVEQTGYAPVEHPTFQPGRVAALTLNGQQIGVLGEVHPSVRASFDLPDQRICLAEIELNKLLAAAQPIERFIEISRMPPLKLDLAVVVDEDVAANEVQAVIHEVGGRLLVDVILFDVYRSDQLGAGKKSLAYSLTFQSPDVTLTSEQATKQRDRIVEQLTRRLGAEIRS